MFSKLKLPVLREIDFHKKKQTSNQVDKKKSIKANAYLPDNAKFVNLSCEAITIQI
jgi:hypothetical protein